MLLLSTIFNSILDQDQVIFESVDIWSDKFVLEIKLIYSILDQIIFRSVDIWYNKLAL